MHIKLYKVRNIDDYFFHLINPSKKEVNILNSKYPKGVEEIKTINLNYEYNDIFLDKFLNTELLKIVANNIFFRFDSLDKFIDIINVALISFDYEPWSAYYITYQYMYL